MRIVCISDTHMKHRQLVLPEGDVLVHAGDFTRRGEDRDIVQFNAWLAKLDFKHKIVIAGNHDFGFQDSPDVARLLLNDATYLEDSGVEIDGIHFWGSPWQPWFHSWAFNLERGKQLAAKWALIPTNTDVLITHGPPMGILDMTDSGEPVGCEALRDELYRVRPKLHVFGHIHESYGETAVDRTIYVNAASCNRMYLASNPPIVVDP